MLFFFRLAEALEHWICLPKPALSSHSRKMQKMSLILFLRVPAIAVLIFTRFYCRPITFEICMTHFTMKMLQVTYFVIRYDSSRASHVRMRTLMALGAFRMRKKNKTPFFQSAKFEAKFF